MKFDRLYTLLFEDANSQEKQALNILNRAKISNPEEQLEKLKSITARYQGANNPLFRSAKNQAHLPKLAKFFAAGNVNLNQIKYYYDKYMEMPKLNVKPIDIFTDFHAFEQEIDSNFISKEVDTNSNKDISSDAIYSDDNIEVYLGDTKQKCIKYGQGTKYGLCISRNDSSNMFHHYRWENEMTTYFVYFKDKSINPPSNFIIIDAIEQSPNTFSYNIITPNSDRKISKDELVQKFPQIETALNNNIFKQKPIEGQELEYYNKYYGKDVRDFTSLDDQINFIEMGEELDPYAWTYLSKNTINQLLPRYIEIGHDVPLYLLNEYPKFKNRYNQKLKQRVEMNISDKTHYDDYTDGEIKYAIENVSVIRDHFKKAASIEEKQIRNKLRDNVFTGNIFVKCLYILPDLSDVIIDGDFTCGHNKLFSLEGAPKTIKGSFYCSYSHLTSLEGAPTSIGRDFQCLYNNRLLSLKGAPESVGESLKIIGNRQLTSLEGAPKSVERDICCESNYQLTSLEGLPEEISGNFYCFKNNNLTSLKGAPKSVGGGFVCNNNLKLISLEGAPETVKGNVFCDNNNSLINLKGAPKSVGQSFICKYNNNLNSLEGSPEIVLREFECTGNDNLTSLKGSPKTVKGDFICTYNGRLTSLEGAPKTIKGNFICDNNDNLISLEGAPETVEGLIQFNNYNISKTDYNKFIEKRNMNKYRKDRQHIPKFSGDKYISESFKQFFYRRYT